MKPKIFQVSQTPKGLTQIVTLKPDVIKEHYCAVINVSDSPCATFDYQRAGMPSFWFPINEMAKWTHAPFYGALKVVNEYYEGNKKVLIHCHAGANRSPCIAFAILLTKGYTWQEAEESLNYERLYWVFQRNIKRGHIPPDIIKFLMGCDIDSTFSIMGVLRKQDALVAEITERKMTEQNNYNLSEIGEQGRLIYRKDLKRFVVEASKEPDYTEAEKLREKYGEIF
jgi:hypothetical protein